MTDDERDRLKAAWHEAHERLLAIIKERDGREEVPHELDMRHIRTVREIAELSEAMHRKADRTP